MGIQHGHGVATSPTTLVLIGGLNPDDQIISYDIELQEWTEVGSLIEGRTDHRCAFYNGKLVVTGGYGASRSTEYLSKKSYNNGWKKVKEGKDLF